MATLEQLDGEVWGEPEFQSGLLLRCHALRKKDLADFSDDDLRVLLCQGFSTEHLAPIAIGRLQRDPIAEADRYPGALLSCLIQQKNWERLRPYRAQVNQIAHRALELLPPEAFTAEGRQYVDLPSAIAAYINH